MAFCSNCGAKLNDGNKFCQSCGNPVTQSAAQPAPNPTPAMDPETKDIEDNKWIACLSYLGPLVFIPMFVKPESSYTKYHVKQGFNMFVVWVAYIIVGILLNLIKVTKIKYVWGIPAYEYKVTPWYIVTICWLLGLAVAALAILGIVYAIMGKKKELPLIGNLDLSSKLGIIK